ncbi:hypothetical protein WN55_03515 [Dufourea novaeangliae]|uniref:Uncharacterized protein n=1 Tax=Dufourea novaeangliae TaxID=178035 RepID=A0A154PLA8_DUFNO|nr:hypothetical protein WN55_03515 [Dufourea novaeangliae]
MGYLCSRISAWPIENLEIISNGNRALPNENRKCRNGNRIDVYNVICKMPPRGTIRVLENISRGDRDISRYEFYQSTCLHDVARKTKPEER